MGLEPRRLVDRVPELDADGFVARFAPPRRFAAVRFATYVPNPERSSQRAAVTELERVAGELSAAVPADNGRRWLRRTPSPVAPASPAGRYIDGGFGVGKTHLLAALWHTAPEPKAYVTFAELTALIGFLGMDRAVESFRGYRLLCIDEFELDDVANTLMTVTFLRSIVPDTKVVATSNSLPDRLGEGRFHAEDFRREIAAIASHFEVVRIDGPDYRRGVRIIEDAVDDAVLDELASRLAARSSDDSFDALLDHLRRVHPVRFGALLDGLDAVIVRGMHPIANQGDALLFCHLVDKLYDAEVTFAASGCAVGALFPESYRQGGYRKKYGRAESRVSAMLADLQGA